MIMHGFEMSDFVQFCCVCIERDNFKNQCFSRLNCSKYSYFAVYFISNY